MKLKNNKLGFSFVEIMTTTGITVLIAAISIFIFLRIRINVNDAAALSNVQSIAEAVDNYQMTYKSCPASITALATANPPYISDAFADNVHQGYRYLIKKRSIEGKFLKGPYNCVVTAEPEVPGSTGTKYFAYYNKELITFDFVGNLYYFITGNAGDPGGPGGG